MNPKPTGHWKIESLFLHNTSTHLCCGWESWKNGGKQSKGAEEQGRERSPSRCSDLDATKLTYGQQRIADMAKEEPLSTVPFPRDPAFVETAEYRQLDAEVSSGKCRVALAGMGGVG